MFYGFLLIWLILVSKVISKQVYKNVGDVLYEKYTNKGYILNEVFFLVYTENILLQLNRSRKNLSLFGKVIDKIEDLIPIYNVHKAHFIVDNSCDIIVDSLIKENYLIPMDFEDQRKVDEMKKKGKKYFCSEENQKKLTNEWERELIEEKTICLNFSAFPYLGYNLEEIKKLNDAVGGKFIYGRFDGIKTAIIGIPFENAVIEKIILPSEKYRIEHEFLPLSEEEIVNSKFVVYSYKCSEEDKSIVPVLEDIENKRLNTKKNEFCSCDKEDFKKNEKRLRYGLQK